MSYLFVRSSAPVQLNCDLLRRQIVAQHQCADCFSFGNRRASPFTVNFILNVASYPAASDPRSGKPRDLTMWRQHVIRVPAWKRRLLARMEKTIMSWIQINDYDHPQGWGNVPDARSAPKAIASSLKQAESFISIIRLSIFHKPIAIFCFRASRAACEFTRTFHTARNPMRFAALPTMIPKPTSGSSRSCGTILRR